ncbi:hypothetical protein JCM10908_007215 [Rhodotorula pacifica]|uniref:uncharacterized protein n=1 Tax=Rhodotorula pacifica TaxID=1495444 RepID=UPI003177957B
MSRPSRNASGAKSSASTTKPPSGPAETRVSLMDLIWMLQPVPLGTPHSLPALGSPHPWYILPAIYSPMPAPWDRAPNEETSRLEQTHAEAVRTAKVLAQAEAEEPRDPAVVKTEQNRKKKERKLRAKARREAEGAGAADKEEEEVEENEVAGASAEVDQEGQKADTRDATQEAEKDPAAAASEKGTTKQGDNVTPAQPTVSYALPSYLDEKMQQEFLKHYATLHADLAERRQDEAYLLPKQFQSVPVGHAYMYPREHPEDPQRGVTWDKESMTLLYHTE